jgi:hypothetical protein
MKCSEGSTRTCLRDEGNKDTIRSRDEQRMVLVLDHINEEKPTRAHFPNDPAHFAQISGDIKWRPPNGDWV